MHITKEIEEQLANVIASNVNALIEEFTGSMTDEEFERFLRVADVTSLSIFLNQVENSVSQPRRLALTRRIVQERSEEPPFAVVDGKAVIPRIVPTLTPVVALMRASGNHQERSIKRQRAEIAVICRKHNLRIADEIIVHGNPAVDKRVIAAAERHDTDGFVFSDIGTMVMNETEAQAFIELMQKAQRKS